MADERAENETETGEVSSDTAEESEYTNDFDPAAAKRRLLKLIDDELDDSPKGLVAKAIVDELPTDE